MIMVDEWVGIGTFRNEYWVESEIDPIMGF